MLYILEDMFQGEISHGFYAGQSPKYWDIFYVVPKAHMAKPFRTQEEAQQKAEALNKVGYNFVIREISPENLDNPSPSATT